MEPSTEKEICRRMEEADLSFASLLLALRNSSDDLDLKDSVKQKVPNFEMITTDIPFQVSDVGNIQKVIEHRFSETSNDIYFPNLSYFYTSQP